MERTALARARAACASLPGKHAPGLVLLRSESRPPIWRWALTAQVALRTQPARALDQAKRSRLAAPVPPAAAACAKRLASGRIPPAHGPAETSRCRSAKAALPRNPGGDEATRPRRRHRVPVAPLGRTRHHGAG